MNDEERLLLFTNDVAVGLFPRETETLCVVLSPDGASLTAVRGETVRRCLTRFCPTAMAACMARLVAFRNMHAAIPYVCERFLADDVPRWRRGVNKPTEDVPTVSWCPLQRRMCVQTVANVLSADPMVEIRHGRTHTATNITRVLPAGNAASSSSPPPSPPAAVAAECTAAFVEDLLPELQGLLRNTDQYPSSAAHAVRVQAVGDATFIIRAGGAEDGGRHLAVEAWFHEESTSPLPLGPTLTLEHELFTYRWTGDNDKDEGGCLDIHVGLLDGLFDVDGASDEVGAGPVDDGNLVVSASSVLRRHRGAALRLLQYREYLERRRRCFAPPPGRTAASSSSSSSSSSSTAPGSTYYLVEGRLMQKEPRADRWDRATPSGTGDNDEVDDASHGIVTLVLSSGATFRAFPSLDDRAAGVEPFGRLRGVFPDRTHATVHLEADPVQGAAARSARLLLPDGTETAAPLTAFAAVSNIAAHPQASYVTALLSFHRWACAPPARRAALMEKMQAVAAMGVAADARSRRHLSIEELRNGKGRGRLAATVAVENEAPPPPPPLSAATCAFRVRDALRASQQALRDNALLLNR
jgi:hypothetical protein